MRKYFKHTIKQTLNIKKILALDFISWQTSHTAPPEIHDFWEFIYVLSGDIEYAVNDANNSLKSGQMLLLPPNAFHQFTVSNKKDANLLFICFECFSPIVQPLANFPLFVSNEDSELLSNIINEIRATFKTSSLDKLIPLENPILGGEQCIKNLFETLIIRLLRHPELYTQNKIFFHTEDNVDAICKQIHLFLKKNVYKKITIDEVANNINYSKYYISHIFKERYKKSIISLFNELKIEEAKKLLASTAISITNISNMRNFSDPRFFNHTFKKYVNRTPSSYREQALKTTTHPQKTNLF